MHKYSGQCAPGNGRMLANNTFSVGCYEVGPKANGKGEKRIGAVKVRVSGYVSNTGAVYNRKAEEICDQLDAGTYFGPKNVRAK